MQGEQYDINCAYQNAKLEETIYMEPAKQLSAALTLISAHHDQGDTTRKTLKTLNDIQGRNKVAKPSWEIWHKTMDDELKRCGAKRIAADSCFYYVAIKLAERAITKFLALKIT